MKWKKIASLLLITALFLSFLGCGERAQPESTAPDDSALLQMRQYQSSMEAFQSDCTQQIHAFTASLQSGDTEAGNAAADTLTTRLAGFGKTVLPKLPSTPIAALKRSHIVSIIPSLIIGYLSNACSRSPNPN